jgi:hypothetical protein
MRGEVPLIHTLHRQHLGQLLEICFHGNTVKYENSSLKMLCEVANTFKIKIKERKETKKDTFPLIRGLYYSIVHR